jgi:hypothetical protein
MTSGNFAGGNWTVVDGRILIAKSPADIIIIAAGDGGGLHSTYMQPFCASLACSARVWEPADA